MATVSLVPVDPYHPVVGLLVPEISRRVQEFARTYVCELNPEQLARSIMSRLWLLDPAQAILAFVDEQGHVVGHSVATIESDGVARWVFVSQTRVDGDVGDAVGRAIEMADSWGQSVGATKLVMATHRSDTPWSKKYGFKIHRHLMVRDIGKGVSEGE